MAAIEARVQEGGRVGGDRTDLPPTSPPGSEAPDAFVGDAAVPTVVRGVIAISPGTTLHPGRRIAAGTGRAERVARPADPVADPRDTAAVWRHHRGAAKGADGSAAKRGGENDLDGRAKAPTAVVGPAVPSRIGDGRLVYRPRRAVIRAVPATLNIGVVTAAAGADVGDFERRKYVLFVQSGKSTRHSLLCTNKTVTIRGRRCSS